MKRIISIFSIAAVMVACQTSPKPDAEARIKAYTDSLKLAADTAGLSQFQAWKAQNELQDPNQYGQNQYAVAPVTNAPRSYAPVRRTTRSSSASRSSGSRTYESGNTAKAPAKKGCSKAAKGAVIGGAAGAAAGAVINKRNRAVGAVVGGVLGGGVGYGIGRSKDKADGRY